jgi:hypothetical protein
LSHPYYTAADAIQEASWSAATSDEIVMHPDGRVTETRNSQPLPPPPSLVVLSKKKKSLPY